MRILAISLTAVMGLAPIRAADIEGNVVIQHKLTKRKVTLTTGSYDRGAAVELDSEPPGDPLAFERTRVVVYLEGEHASKPVTAVLEQKNRRFVQDTLVVPAGSTVSFPNRDTVFHNVFSLSKQKSFDLGNFPKDETRTVTFSKPGTILVFCRLHPNMSAAIVVSPNRWSTKADAAGRFALTGVPPGAYTIVAWHKAAGFFRQNIQVTGDRATAVEFFIPLDSNGVRRQGVARAVARR